ncbi:hypothetical protein ACH4UM_31860 [Streptomyces sp. NPDC020801]|uniref:hypothetical protein n=1 Tax=unclassified Streptomyces TaxID=2593676 RepID=UPI0037B25982
MRHLRLVGDTTAGGTGTHGCAPLVGYLVLVPEGTDPAQLFAGDVPRPEIRPVAHEEWPPAQQPGGDAIRVDHARRVAELDGRELPAGVDGILSHVIEGDDASHYTPTAA